MKSIATALVLVGCLSGDTVDIGPPPALDFPALDNAHVWTGHDDAGNVIIIMTPQTYYTLAEQVGDASNWMRQADQLLAR